MENEWNKGLNEKYTRLKETLKQEVKKKSVKATCIVKQ